jgi:cell wall-associated NlpC family hydrolase
VAATESEIAAQLIERLLADPSFRDRFRRDPALACREAGLHELAEEMRLGGGKAMHTLDIRESRSSLAGVMMAAAMEGMGLYEFSKHVVPHIEDLTGSLGDVLSRVNLPALPGAGSLSGPPERSAASVAPPDAAGEEAAAAGGNGGAPAVAPVAPATAPAAPEEGGGAKADAPDKSGAPAPPEAGAAAKSEKPPVAPELADAKKKPAEDGGDELRTGTPGGAELPEGPIRLEPSEGGPEPADAGAAQPAPAPPVAPEVAAGSAAPAAPVSVDPGTLGQEGSGGAPTAEGLALLKNKNVVLDDVGVADIKAGRIDPRIVAVATKLSQEHKIVVSCMCSDHSKFTAGGSISNHAFGRGMDIASIDGEIVSPGSALARDIASELSELDPAIRPDEIGSPFAINGPGYFTDAAHQNHIHVGFKQEITPEFKLPGELAAGAPAPAPAPDPAKDSGLFAALAQPGKLASATPQPGKAGDSGLFAAAVQDKAQAAQPAAAPAAAAAAEAPAVELASTGYPGDNAPREQIAAWMGAEAQKRGLPPQLPVMAGLVESGLKNLNFGDADSVGFFQMRLSIWNQGEYAGYPDDPNKQLDWFLDQAEAIKNQRVSRGQPIDDPSQFGEWIADVERPAEQFRGRYQLQLDQANQLLQNAPQQTPTPPEAATEAPQPELAPPAMAKGAGPKALAALEEAKKYTGTPYRWGGSTPQTGFDCSGLVQWAYAHAGVKIPRVTDDQIAATNGTPVARAELLPGDLVFFRDSSGYVHHVGISMGGDKFLHAPHTGDVVKVSSLDEPYYKEQFTGGRRFDAPAAGAPAAAPAAAAPAAPAAPAAAELDPVAVASAQAAVARDAAEAQQQDSGLFRAIAAQEARKEAAEGDRALASAGEEAERSPDSGLFLRAITEEQAAKARAEAATPAAAAPAEPAAPSPAAPEEAAAQPAGAPPDLSAVPADYPGDDAGQEALAKWLAKEAEKAGLPPELPVMAALVESGVKNLNFGDADSVGFFQMRLSIWNQGEYAGYPDNPGLQIKWFVDHALAHKKQQIARGDADFGRDPATWGEWIADVERPAEQFRGRYQLRLEEARRLLG